MAPETDGISLSKGSIIFQLPCCTILLGLVTEVGLVKKKLLKNAPGGFGEKGKNKCIYTPVFHQLFWWLFLFLYNSMLGCKKICHDNFSWANEKMIG